MPMQTQTLRPDAPVRGEMPGRTFDVLILDDLATDRMRLRRLLRDAGLRFDLHEADNLASFREKIAQAPMDLVFLDYNLGMDSGLDALRILLDHDMQIEALPIMVTGVERCDLAVEAMRAGCADYLIKDQMTVESIRKAVASAFERRVLVSAITEAHHARRAARNSVARLAEVCGPEIRAVLAATLRHARSLRGRPEMPEDAASHLRHLEQGCQDIFAFLSSVVELLERSDGEIEGSIKRTIGK
jgi:DNA-binding NarL/FixJ family response regulator